MVLIELKSGLDCPLVMNNSAHFKTMGRTLSEKSQGTVEAIINGDSW
jgi:hypothetical protein